MAALASIRFITRRFPSTITRPCVSVIPLADPISCNSRALRAANGLVCQSSLSEFSGVRYMSSNASVQLKTDDKVVRFSFNQLSHKSSPPDEGTIQTKRAKISRKAKLNELRFYRLKAKKKMNSPNPEVRIRYKLEKTKRKEEWLIEKLRNFETPKAPAEKHDPELLTEEEKHYLKRTGEKKGNYVQVGRRGVFGGVVLNMHLHWKKHETVKVSCKPCRPGQVHVFAEELARLSKGIVIDIKPDNTIIFYRGKNYVQPTVMCPPETLSKAKALEKYKYLQSLEHTSKFVERLEKELEEYLKHVEQFKKTKDCVSQDFMAGELMGHPIQQKLRMQCCEQQCVLVWNRCIKRGHKYFLLLGRLKVDMFQNR